MSRVGGATEIEVKERKDRVEDAMHASRAAVEEGVLPGGGVALLYAAKALDALQTTNDDQRVGINIVRRAMQAAVRQIVGDRSVTEVLTVGRREVADEAHLVMQEILNSYETGIQIETVNLKDVNPPTPVKPSFNEVNEAKQEKERLINEAWSEYNKAVPAAEGEAERVIRAAEGYALARVNRAEGDAERFVAVWREYSRARDVTKRRLYLETMSEILPQIPNKIIVDPELKNLIPLLQLDAKGGGK